MTAISRFTLARAGGSLYCSLELDTGLHVVSYVQERDDKCEPDGSSQASSRALDSLTPAEFEASWSMQQTELVLK
ncbi:MAG: hypothetical protein OHK0023_04190 [Anaerolineae bacterium]